MSPEKGFIPQAHCFHVELAYLSVCSFSLCDVEELLVERGIMVTCETARRQLVLAQRHEDHRMGAHSYTASC
jgi:hypothetical protein